MRSLYGIVRSTPGMSVDTLMNLTATPEGPQKIATILELEDKVFQVLDRMKLVPAPGVRPRYEHLMRHARMLYKADSTIYDCILGVGFGRSKPKSSTFSRGDSGLGAAGTGLSRGQSGLGCVMKSREASRPTYQRLEVAAPSPPATRCRMG